MADVRTKALIQQKLKTDAVQELWDRGFQDGREGKKPQVEDIEYFKGWGAGYGLLAYEKWTGPGLVPSMEWQARSPMMVRHMEATDPNYGAEAPQF